MRLRPHTAGPHDRGLDPRLTWAPPELDNPTTYNLSSTNRRALIPYNQDAIINLGDTDVSVSGGIEIVGGRNVVLIGGRINMSADYSSGYPSTTNLGMKLQGNSSSFTYSGAGTPTEPQRIHIEGLRMSSTDPGYITDAFYYQANQQTEAYLTFQNVRVDGLSYGWETNEDGTQGPHADILQCVGGPTQVRMDRFTATRFGYQGLFFQMNQSAPTGRVAGNPDLRNVNLRPSTGEAPTGMTYTTGGRYGLYLTNTEITAGRVVCCDNVYVGENPDHQVSNNPWYPESGAWLRGEVTAGNPPFGDFVGEGDCGIGYVTPGYRGVS